MNVLELKRSQLNDVALHREKLRKNPHLKWLFFEITNRCNLYCRHCGSICSGNGQSLTIEDIRNVLSSVSPYEPSICLTGGEPMLHPDFFEIAVCVRNMGFFWGMTTNATLIDDASALKLRQTGMSTVSVSLDGMESAHDSLRQHKGAWQLALRGIKALQRAGFKPQVTTVIHQQNMVDLDPLYDLLCKMRITNWRIINVEPIGRACESDDLLLTPEQFTDLINYIKGKRFDQTCKMRVTFGCSHYLGAAYERMVRDHYFLCGAGTLIASIRSNGDICACLDIANRPELVQGNIHKDSFKDIWENHFEAFRRDRTTDCSKCLQCPDRFICGGDSAHTWNYEKNEPLLCYQDFHL